MDKQREKLIDLIQNSVGYCATYWATRIADHLLADKEIKHAFELLKAEYERAKEMEYVQKPLAWALFQVWRKVDRMKGGDT